MPYFLYQHEVLRGLEIVGLAPGPIPFQEVLDHTLDLLASAPPSAGSYRGDRRYILDQPVLGCGHEVP